MAFYPDLGPCDYLGAESAGGLKAIGWLEEGADYPRGKSEPRFVHKLVLLFAEPWVHEPAADPHTCSLCSFSRGPERFQLWQAPGMPAVTLGNRNLFVPGKGFLYVAPSLILHYLDAHQYVAPEEFVTAVMECPPVRSQDYLKAVRAHAPKGLKLPD